MNKENQDLFKQSEAGNISRRDFLVGASASGVLAGLGLTEMAKLVKARAKETPGQRDLKFEIEINEKLPELDSAFHEIENTQNLIIANAQNIIEACFKMTSITGRVPLPISELEAIMEDVDGFLEAFINDFQNYSLWLATARSLAVKNKNILTPNLNQACQTKLAGFMSFEKAQVNFISAVKENLDLAEQALKKSKGG